MARVKGFLVVVKLVGLFTGATMVIYRGVNTPVETRRRLDRLKMSEGRATIASLRRGKRCWDRREEEVGGGICVG